MNKLIKKIGIAIIILNFTAFTNFIISAELSRDFESWSSIELQFKPNKKLTFALEGEIRLFNDSSTIDQYFTHLNVDYELLNNLELGVGLRYIRNNDLKGKIQGFENHLRYNLDLSYKHKIGPIAIKHRLRYQNRNELGISSLEGDYANKHIRFKTSLIWKIKNWKLDPVFSAEIFRHYEEGEKTEFDKYRLTFGTNYKIKKLGKIGLFYRMEQSLNDVIKKTTHILMLKYSYSFN